MMATQDQLIPIPFRRGVDSKTDRKQLQTGQLLELWNGVFKNTGAIDKRFGYDVLSLSINGGDNITAGVALSVFQSELLLYTGERVYSRLSASLNWADRGQVVSVILSTKSIRANGYQQTNPDFAFNLGWEVSAWEDSRGGVRYSVADHDTGAVLIDDASVSTIGSKPKVIALQRFILIFYTDGGSVKYRSINTAAPRLLSNEVVATSNLLTAHPLYDITKVADRVYLAFADTAHGTGLGYVDSNLTAGGEISIDGYPSSCITAWGDTQQNCWIAYHDGYNVKSTVVTYASNILLTPTSVSATTETIKTITGIESVLGGTSTLFWEVDAANRINQFVRTNSMSLSGTAGTTSVFKRSVGLASKAFKYGHTTYVNVAYESKLQSTYFTYDASGNQASKIVPDNAGGHRTNTTLPQVDLFSDGIFTFAGLKKGRLISDDRSEDANARVQRVNKSGLFSLTGVIGVSLDFISPNKFLSVELGGNLYTVGAFLQTYDGVGFNEHNFNVYPDSEGIQLAGYTIAGGPLALGSYQYIVQYEWTDNANKIVKSTTSEVQSITISGGANSINVTVPMLRLTGKRDVRIAIYRTEVNGLTFYRTTSISNPLRNDPTVDSKVYNDNLSDSDLISHERINIDGFALDTDAPPSCKLIAVYRNRVWLAGLEDPQTLAYSQELVPGEPVAFSALFTMPCGSKGGPISALGTLDDNLIIFKEAALFRQSGAGPDNTGSTGFYDDPQLITTDVGCTNPNSVAEFKYGLVFQSPKGIMLLDQGFNVQYIGDKVQKYNNLEISSTTVIPDQNIIIFTTENDVALVYDYYMSQETGEHTWSIFTNHQAVDSIIWKNNTFAMLKKNGAVYQQNKSKYTDGSSLIPLKLRTAFMSLAGLQGFQRVKRAAILGEFKGPHKLQVQVSYDFNEQFSYEYTVDATALFASDLWGSGAVWGSDTVWGGPYSPYHFVLPALTRQKCQSISFTISDSQSSNYNEGYSISGLTLMVGMKQGINKVPKVNKFGS